MKGKESTMRQALPLVGLLLLFTTCGNPLIVKIMGRGQEDDFTFYTVTFDSMGGSPVAPQKVREGEPVPRPADPIHPNEDLYFVDWYNNESYTEAPYDFNTPVAKDFTLYAKWDDIPPEDLPDQDRWYYEEFDSTAKVDHFSVDAEGVCKVTIGGTAELHTFEDGWNAWKVRAAYSYTAKSNTMYAYEFEAWTDPDDGRVLHVQYDYDEDQDILGEDYISLRSTPMRYKVIGEVSKGGVRSLYFLAAHYLGTFYVKMISIKEYVPPESWPIEERWYTWNAPESTAIVTHSVAPDGMCTITVGGTPDVIRWHSSTQYKYTAKENAVYEYSFWAWTTPSGARQVTLQYYNDWYGNGEILSEVINITDTPELYTITGAPLPKGGEREIEFQCADQQGTFYVQIVSITQVQ